jgi:hypothetical protein
MGTADQKPTPKFGVGWVRPLFLAAVTQHAKAPLARVDGVGLRAARTSRDNGACIGRANPTYVCFALDP